MHGATVALPCTPMEALDGLPSAAVLSTPAKRRRYGQALACALAGIPSWTIETMSWDECPPVLELRAGQEDWPMIGSFRDGQSYLTILRPVPLPHEPIALIEAAVERTPAHFRGPAAEILAALLQGQLPARPPSQVGQKLLGDAIRRAAATAFRAALVVGDAPG